jgi:nicotinic acid mononucleotide adenylyltransferase
MKKEESLQNLYFFGRFNFPHAGYLYVIRESLLQLKPKNGIKIVFSAEQTTWEKQALPMRQREEMFTLALADFPEDLRRQVHFSAIEETLHTGGYTIDTLRALHKKQSGSSAIVMGADAAIGIPELHAGFTSWKNWQEILELAILVIVPRGRYPTAQSIRNHLPTGLESATILSTTPTDRELHASSTAILAGRHEFLSPGVLTYAQQHKLLAA